MLIRGEEIPDQEALGEIVDSQGEVTDCRCGWPITFYDGEWMHVFNDRFAGTEDHEPSPAYEQWCSQCGAPLDDGEGYDGSCGNCADRAEAKTERERSPAVPSAGL